MIKIEINFPFDIKISDKLYQEIDEVITHYICKPYEKAHPDRVMWVSGGGYKMNCSKIDAMLLGKHEFDETIPDGDEPTFDESICEINISERAKY